MARGVNGQVGEWERPQVTVLRRRESGVTAPSGGEETQNKEDEWRVH